MKAIHIWFVLSVIVVAVSVTVAVQASRKTSKAPVEPDVRVEVKEDPKPAQSEVEQLTRDSNPRTRQKAIELLQECRPDVAVRLCPELFQKEKDPGVVMAWLDLTGNRKVKGVFPVVLEHLQQGGDLPTRAKAAWAIGQMADVLDTAQREEARKALVEAIELKPPAGGSPHKGQPTVTGKSDIGLPLACVDALGLLKDPASSAALVALLRSDTSPIVRRAVVRCLPGIVQQEQIAALQAAWRDERDAMVRGDIERLLGKEPFNLAFDRSKGGFIPKAPPQKTPTEPK